MSDLTATVRVEHPDLALTGTVAHDPTATVQPVTEAGTDPESGSYLFTIQSADFERFEAGLRADHTVAAFEQVVELDGEAVYRFEYTDRAKLFSPVVTTANGVALAIENDGTAWTMTVWLPDRAGLARLWEYAAENDIRIDLRRVNDYASPLETDAGLTESQHEALLVALDAGYFEEPRAASLADVAAELGISGPAASGLLRRGVRRLVLSALAPAGEERRDP